MFFTFDQNNSGGSFVRNKNLDKYVIIEAETAELANVFAMMLGIYFNGCSTGTDCSCCGDRWHPTHEDEGTPEPMYWGQPVAEATSMFGSDTIKVHYLDGSIATHVSRKVPWEPLTP